MQVRNQCRSVGDRRDERDAEQAIGIQQVNASVGEMDATTQESESISQDSVSIAIQLNAQVDELSKMINEFKLNADLSETTYSVNFGQNVAVAEPV